MAKISKDDVLHAAELARIKLADEEVAKTTEDLEKILDYVAELDEAPTENIEAIEQISDLANVTREDQIEPSLGVEKVLGGAPQKQDGFIKTKKIFA